MNTKYKKRLMLHYKDLRAAVEMMIKNIFFKDMPTDKEKCWVSTSNKLLLPSTSILDDVKKTAVRVNYFFQLHFKIIKYTNTDELGAVTGTCDRRSRLRGLPVITTRAFTAPAQYSKLPQVNNVTSFIHFLTTWLPIKEQCCHSIFAMTY